MVNNAPNEAILGVVMMKGCSISILWKFFFFSCLLNFVLTSLYTSLYSFFLPFHAHRLNAHALSTYIEKKSQKLCLVLALYPDS